MPHNPHKVQLGSFVISPSVRKAMEAQRGQQPARIPVIVSLVESKTKPAQGIQPAKEAVKAFLAGKAGKIEESQYYVFAELLPETILQLAEMKEYVQRIWTDKTCFAQLLTPSTTVKAAAWAMFGARGNGITWAVLAICRGRVDRPQRAGGKSNADHHSAGVEDYAKRGLRAATGGCLWKNSES